MPDDVPLIIGDVTDQECVSDVLKQHFVNAVMHFAGSVRVDESVTDPLKYYRNNSSASRTLIEACVDGGVERFVFSSTAAAYGIPEKLPVDETTRLAPINPYGHSKVMTEQVLRDTGAATGLSYAILRYFNVASAGADPAGRTGQATPNATHLIKVACEVATGARRGMEVFGTDYDTPDGTCVRDFIHVSDLADAHVRVLDWLGSGRRNGTFNCGYGRGYSVRDVLAALEKVTGRKLTVSYTGHRAGDSPEIIADSSLIRRETGWTPSHDDLETIVRTALEWERKLVAA